MKHERNELIQALENERRYIARELHDGVAQTALQLGLYGGICKKLVERGEMDMLVEQLTEMEGRIQLVSAQVRELIADFRPPLVEPGSGLLEYLQQAIDIHHDRKGATVTYRNRLTDDVPQYSIQEIVNLSRIVQEALLNIRKHAQANNVLIDLSGDDKHILIIIADDGVGFDIDEVEHRPVDKGGAGLQNMHARASALDGSLKITKGTRDGGTAVRITIPINEQPWW